MAVRVGWRPLRAALCAPAVSGGPVVGSRRGKELIAQGGTAKARSLAERSLTVDLRAHPGAVLVIDPFTSAANERFRHEDRSRADVADAGGAI